GVSGRRPPIREGFFSSCMSLHGRLGRGASGSERIGTERENQAAAVGGARRSLRRGAPFEARSGAGSNTAGSGGGAGRASASPGCVSAGACTLQQARHSLVAWHWATAACRRERPTTASRIAAQAIRERPPPSGPSRLGPLVHP